MPKYARLPRRCSLENLEPRRLMAAADFGDAGVGIRLGSALAAFPAATGAGQVVAVVDSGVDYDHPSLGGGFGPAFKVVGGYDFVDDDADPMDVLGHGTEVAGIIAAKPPTATGGDRYQGVAPDAKVVALRVDDGDPGTSVPDALIEKALQWTVDHQAEFGITVVNISYGQGRYPDPTVSTVYGDEIVALRDLGVTIVAAAGNGGVNTQAGGINSPAADPSVVSVGGLNANNKISSVSQRSANLTLFAPGEDVLTTFLGGGTGLVGGTSYSAPIVAGTVALMKNLDASLRPADAISVLRASGLTVYDGGTGNSVTRRTYPRLDVLNALNLANARKPGTMQQQADVGKLGNQNAVAIDPQGVTHYVYYDVSARTMKYATRNTAGQWSNTQNIDNTLPFQGYYLSMAVDPQGQAAVAYFDGQNGDLKYARNTGTNWERTSLDVKNSTGAYNSLVFDRNGRPLITYYRKTSGDLRAARQGEDGQWSITTIASAGDVGRSTSAAVNPSTGAIGVAYEDSTRGYLGYSELNPKTNKWTSTVADAKTRGLAYVSMAFATDTNRPWVAYYDANPANLKVARFGSNKRWNAETVVSRGAVGLFNNLFFAGDQPNVVFWDKTLNGLYRATLDGGEWSSELLKANGGRFAAGVPDRTGAAYRYAYYQAGNLLTDQFDI